MNRTEMAGPDRSPLHSSGVEAIDSAWGGLYRGGAYLYYGEAAAGRNLLTLLFARAGDSLEEQSIFISSDRYSELKIQAGSLGFDFEDVLEQGNLHLVRIPPRMKLREIGDDGVAQALSNLTSPFTAYHPKRLIINDFMPFVAFRSFERFRIEFVRFLERTDSMGATLILAMPEPANEHSQRIIDFMRSHMTGAIHLERHSDSPLSTKRILTLTPTSGHIKGFSFEHWDLEDIVSPGHQASDREVPRQPLAAPEVRPGSNMDSTPDLEAQTSESPVEASEEESPETRAPSNEPSVSRPGFSHNPLISPGLEPFAAPPVGQRRGPDPSELPVGSGADVDITDRPSFERRLRRAISGDDRTSSLFMLIAMRVEDAGSGTDSALSFEYLLDIVHDILKPHDDMLADMDSRQLIVLLAHAGDTEADAFFAQIRDRLLDESPATGPALLNRISAVVSDHGEPFDEPASFIDFVFDGPNAI